MKISGVGQSALISALDALEKLGYLRRSRDQSHLENGKFGGVRYEFFDKPQEITEPCVDFPYTAEPYTENRAQEIIKQETKKQEIPPKPPRGRAAKPAPDYEPEIFARFWTAYPIGRDKQGAIREWDRLKPSRQLMQTMAAALAKQKETLSAEDPHDRFPFPYAIRWIRDRRWEDDLEKRPHSAPPDVGRTVEAPPGVATW